MSCDPVGSVEPRFGVAQAVASVNPLHPTKRSKSPSIFSQLLAMDASARVTMKDAAKCDKRREWQNSENQENAERILHFQVIPGSMSTSGR